MSGACRWRSGVGGGVVGGGGADAGAGAGAVAARASLSRKGRMIGRGIAVRKYRRPAYWGEREERAKQRRQGRQSGPNPQK